MNADQITGERIHILMRRRGINQDALSPVLGGIAQASVSRKILGKRSWTLDELLAVALFLDVPVTDLLPGNDYDPAPAGRGRNGDVRPKGLEPLTFWLGVGEWTPEDEALYRAEVAAFQLTIQPDGSR